MISQTDLVGLDDTAKASGVREPIPPNEIVEWISEFIGLRNKDLDAYGQTLTWDILVADYASPSMWVIVSFSASSTKLYSGATAQGVGLRSFVDAFEGNDGEQLLLELENRFGKHFWQTSVPAQ
jgi:hypothetical protein